MSLLVDPPSGWMYGFPKYWDKAIHPNLEDLLRESDYPVKDIPFALSNMRFIGTREELKENRDI